MTRFLRISLLVLLLLAGVAARAFTLEMGGAVQNGNVALGNAGSASAVTVYTLAGSAWVTGASDGTGKAAQFSNPAAVTTDGINLYVADAGNNTIRKVVIATGAVAMLAGSAMNFGSNDGTGAAALFFEPSGITTDGTNLYVADTYNRTIRQVVIATGATTTLAGTRSVSGSRDGTGAAASFSLPVGITTDGTNLYVTDSYNNTIRKVVIATGAVTTLAGGKAGSADGTGAAASFNNPASITTDGTNLYVADILNRTIRKVVIANGAVTTLVENVGFEALTNGTGTVFGGSGITTDGPNLYVANNGTIVKVVIATGAATTLAGSAGVSGSTDGTGTTALLNSPSGFTTEGADLYFTDNGTIRGVANTASLAPQTITFGAAPMLGVGTTSTVTASASSGLAVYSTSLTSSICTVSGNTISGIATGTCTIAADQPGNISYAAAARVTQSFQIESFQTITFGAAPTLFAGGTGTVSASASSGLAVSFSSLTPSICTVSGSTVNGVAGGTCTIAADQTGNANFLAAPEVTQAITVTGAVELNLAIGWNLLGNGVNTPINVENIFGSAANASSIGSVWKWEPSGTAAGVVYPAWAFYSPALEGGGKSYAAQKGYDFLTSINPGEGYWVYATAAASLGNLSGVSYSLPTANLAQGWNLVATGDGTAPETFSANIGNVTTLWAWDNTNNNWYFYAPALDANGVLADYIQSKSYESFGTATLGNGMGFWVNYAGVPATVGTAPPTLSADQQIYEHTELNGGSFALAWNMPFGGGNLVSGTNYIYSSTTGGLSLSPLAAGPQLETAALATLDSALAIPSTSPTRYLHGGQIFVRSATAQRRISYVGNNINDDVFADDAQTVVQTSQFYDFSEVSLSGIIGNAPEELNAVISIADWIGFNNFSANAKWQPGALYNKRHGFLVGDTYSVGDCTNVYPHQSTTGASPTPCQYGDTLDNFFPVTLVTSPDKPNEIDLATDGSITTVQGLRMWVANFPLPSDVSATQSYRVFFEMNGNVCMGAVERDGTPYVYKLADDSVVDYYLGLNQAAANSIQQGLITGATVAGSQAGSTAEVATVDLFGIGGHGVNGALAPADLVAHYNIPGNLNGAGQTIAIVDAPGTGDVADDLNVFSQYYNLPQCNSANPCFQHIDLSNGAAVSPTDDWGSEVALDTQMVHAVAPAAKIILVTASSNSHSDMTSAVSFAAGLRGVTAVTMSFGNVSLSPADAQNEDAIFSGFQSNNGTIFFASSGDAGNYSYYGISYPAESIYVTAVGGTRINSVAWNYGAQSEVAWEFSGGGYGSITTVPSWQSSYLGSTNSPIPSTMRLVPDVAAVADYQHSALAIYYKQRWVMSGGTSAASPLWAGISALFGQYLANKGKSLPALVMAMPGGFNGLLYQARSTQSANAGFYDIISGTNNLTSSFCYVCTAIPGYDGVTGLGAPDVAKLFANF
jgi:sugar lactone lactonase YvrE